MTSWIQKSVREAKCNDAGFPVRKDRDDFEPIKFAYFERRDVLASERLHDAGNRAAVSDHQSRFLRAQSGADLTDETVEILLIHGDGFEVEVRGRGRGSLLRSNQVSG